MLLSKQHRQRPLLHQEQAQQGWQGQYPRSEAASMMQAAQPTSGWSMRRLHSVEWRLVSQECCGAARQLSSLTQQLDALASHTWLSSRSGAAVCTALNAYWWQPAHGGPPKLLQASN